MDSTNHFKALKASHFLRVIFIILFSFGLAFQSISQVVVTTATGGEEICVGGGDFPLTDIVITETNPNDIVEHPYGIPYIHL